MEDENIEDNVEMKEVPIKEEQQKEIKKELYWKNNIDNFNEKLSSFLDKIEKYSTEKKQSEENFSLFYSGDLFPNLEKFYTFEPYSRNSKKIIDYFTFVAKYLEIRCNYFNMMSNKELKGIIKLTEKIIQSDIFQLNESNLISEDILIERMKILFENGDVFSYNIEKEEKNHQYNHIHKYFIDVYLKINFFEKFLDFQLTQKFELFEDFLSFLNNLIKEISFYDAKTIKERKISEKIVKLIHRNIKEFFSSHQLKDKSKVYNDLIFNAFSDLLPSFTILYEAGEDINEILSFDLEYAYKLFKLPILEKKQYAVMKLSNLCERMNSESYLLNNPIKKEKIKVMLSFFEQLNFFQLLYGENIHEAIIVKSGDIIQFLYVNKKIEQEQIKYLWKPPLETDQSVGEKIMPVFLRLIPSLSLEHSMFLITLISKENFKEIKESTLTILENLNFATSEQKEKYLNLLFTFSSENSFYKELAPSLILKTRKILSETLLKKNYHKELISYIKKCIYGIGSNNFLNTYCDILRNLLNGIKEKNLIEIYQSFGNFATYQDIIKFLNEKYTLSSTLLFALIDLKKQMIAFAEKISTIQCDIKSNNREKEFKIADIEELMNDFDKIIEQNKEEINTNILSQQTHSNIVINENIPQANNNQHHNNLDNTLSTDKSLEGNENEIFNEDNEQNDNMSLDYSYSSSSTDISNIEKTKRRIILQFLKENKEILSNPNFSNKDNYAFIVQKLKFNFQNDNYSSLVEKIISLFKELILKANLQITKREIEYLAQVLLYNQIDQEEMDIFFNFFSGIIENQRQTNEIRINEENLQYLIFDLLLKYEFFSLPTSAFRCFMQYFILINSMNNNIIYSQSERQIIKLKDFSLLALFNSLWGFYLNPSTNEITENSFKLLLNILQISSKKKSNLKLIYDKIFYEISQSKSKSKEDLSNSVNKQQKLMKILISVHNTVINEHSEYRKKKKGEREKEKDNEMINLQLINNDFIVSIYEKYEFQIKVPSNIKISKLKRRIIELLDQKCKYSFERDNLCLLYNGNYIDTTKNLKELGIKNNSFLLLKKLMETTTVNTDSLNILVPIFPCYSPELLSYALITKNNNVEECVEFISDENNINNLNKMLEIYNEERAYLKEEDDEEEKTEDKDNIDNNALINSEKLEILLSLLDYNNFLINSNVWRFLTNIQFPKNVIDAITQKNFSQIFQYNNKHKLLLNLKLIDSIIFNDECFSENSIEISNEEKMQWIKVLIESEGWNYFNKCLQFLMSQIGEETTFECLDILIRWIKEMLECSKRIIKNEFGLKLQFFDKESALKFLNCFNQIDLYDLILYLLPSNSNLNFNIENFLKNLFDILELMLITNKDNFIKILQREFSKGEMIDVLIKNPNKINRKIVENFFSLLIKKYLNEVIRDNNNNETTIGTMIISHVKNHYEKIFSNIVYEEFFNIFGLMIEKSNDKDDMQKQIEDANSKNQSIINYTDLINHIIQKIIEFIYNVEGSNEDVIMSNVNTQLIPSIDDNESKQEQLGGYVYLFDFLCKNKKDIVVKYIKDKKIQMDKNVDLVDIILRSMFVLEKNPKKEGVIFINFKFSNQNLRQKTYNLLISLAKASKDFKDKILSKLLDHHKTFEINKDIISNMDIPFREINDKYGGLRNYGATCYLNSLIQQLYMMPSFFRSLFQFDINKHQPNSVIRNLQLVFANLKYSNKKYISIMNLITSIKKAFNSSEIDVKIQQDSDEFLAILCDDLEKEAKIYNKEKFLEESFKGKISSEILSLEKEYPYYSAKEEDFFRITLDIKNHQTIEEALDFFINAEILQGDNKYFVEEYQRKISISKRSSIKQLGENVIIHLKRFEFDYNLFMNNKLNDYISFPHEINFQKWTRAYIYANNPDKYKNALQLEESEREYLQENKLKYLLTGVLVHSGASLQHGHYYSLIMDQKSGKWNRYDDTVISPFDKGNIEIECFGENVLQKGNNQMMIEDDQFHRCTNAYLLFYTRKDCFENNRWFNSDVSQKMNKEILNDISQENCEFLTMKTYFNNDYSEFMKQFILNCVNMEESVNNQSELKYRYLTKDLKRNIKISEIINKKIKDLKDKKEQEKEKMKEGLKKERNAIDDSSSDEEQANNEIIITNEEKLHLFEEAYNEYKNEIIIKEDKNESIYDKVVKLGIYYYFTIKLSKAEKSNIASFSNDYLFQILNNNPHASLWLLKKMHKTPLKLFINYLIANQIKEVRSTFKDLVLTCLSSIYSYEIQNQIISLSSPLYYIEKGIVVTKNISFSFFMRFINEIIYQNFQQCISYAEKAESYINLLYKISFLFPLSIKISIRYLENIKDLIKNLINSNQTHANYPKQYKCNSDNSIPDIINLLLTMCLTCVTKGMQKANTFSEFYLLNPNNIHSMDLEVPLPDSLYENLIFPQFLYEILKLPPSNNESSNILVDLITNFTITPQMKLLNHIGFYDKKTSEILLKRIMVIIKESFSEEISMFYILLNTNGLIMISDDYTQFRLKSFFGLEGLFGPKNESIFDLLCQKRMNFTLGVLVGLFAVSLIIGKNEIVRSYIAEKSSELIWIKYFLNNLDGDDNKKSNFVIEASTLNIPFIEILNQCLITYYNLIQ